MTKEQKSGSAVLAEILQWSLDRPQWQRDALRRLMLKGQLSDDDLIELTELCKAAHGLVSPLEAVPLSKEHVPDQASSAPPVSLVSIFHHRGVNALAENQTLKFSPRLTVVYGDNGAGKTGYIRILKGACRSRGQEVILGNVVSSTTPFTPSVEIKYQVGAEPSPRGWTYGNSDPLISRVSIFDTQSAAVYLSERTDVAFRPFGLDLFDKLVQSCKAIRARLEAEQRALSTSTLAPLQSQIPPGTAAASFVANLSSLTDPIAFRKFAYLSETEKSRLLFLEKSLFDLQANDPKKLVQQLTALSTRAKALKDHLKGLEENLSEAATESLFGIRASEKRKAEEARRLREATFSSGLLAGTGTDEWRSLWEAARRFSELHAYHEQTFPVVKDGAKCVLCQQDLDHAASHRLEEFEVFVASLTENELLQIRSQLQQQKNKLNSIITTSEAIESSLNDLRIDYADAADSITEALAQYERRRVAIVKALDTDQELDRDCPSFVSMSGTASVLVEQIEGRIEALKASSDDDARKQMVSEESELRARRIISSNESMILDDIERRKRHAAYGACIDDTRATAITQKSSALTKTAVSQKLKQRFQDELASLNFRHVEVELKELGGEDGVFYHKLVLKRAPGIDVPKVVSEGEQRCLSIAAFFAELSTADDPSGIVFDDPVSSLDFQWRNNVAQRLVQESKTRQVVVFTHDVVFLLALKQFAEEFGVENLDQHVRHQGNVAGVCVEELPWVALPVKKKLGYLKNEWQKASKLLKEGHTAAYEKEATYLYGLLREAWERSLEEVLLGGIVERYRPSIQTQQIAKISDITAADCQAVETAMTKCSKWLPGHDKAAAARAPVPDSDELKADIDHLEQWVAAIRKRRDR